jgi:aldehyde:ferredoxin oxidoreductase
MYGSLLKIDLTTGEVRNEHIPEDYIREFDPAAGAAEHSPDFW